MRLSRSVFACLGLLGSMVLPSRSEAAILYGVTGNDQLLTINTATNAVSSMSLSMSGLSPLGIGRTGSNYYIYAQNVGTYGSLLQVDVASGSLSATTAVGTYPTAEGDLTFAGSSGYMVSNAPSNGDFGISGPLYGFSPSSATYQILGTDNVDASSNQLSFDGLAYNPTTNALYGLTDDGKFLYRRDLTGWVPNAATSISWTLVGATGLPNTYGCAGDPGTPCYSFGGFTYSPSDNKFYAVVSRFSAPDTGSGDPAGVMKAAFFSINTLNGLASAPVELGYLQVSGLTSAYVVTPPTTVPEPSTYALFSVGALALAVLRRRRS